MSAAAMVRNARGALGWFIADRAESLLRLADEIGHEGTLLPEDVPEAFKVGFLLGRGDYVNASRGVPGPVDVDMIEWAAGEMGMSAAELMVTLQSHHLGGHLRAV